MSFIQDLVKIWNNYGGQMLAGVGNTLLIAMLGTVIGLIIGLINGIIRTIPKSRNIFISAIQKIIGVLISAYVEVFRGTPMMVQAMIIYWGYAYATVATHSHLYPQVLLLCRSIPAPILLKSYAEE